MKLEGYTDSSFQSYLNDSKSISGYVFILNGGAVSWKSFEHQTVADSTTKIEYITTSEASKEVVWMKKFIMKLGVVSEIEGLVSLYYDNTGVRNLCLIIDPSTSSNASISFKKL